MKRIFMYDNYLYEGFKFPSDFFEFTSSKKLENLEPWWFFCSKQGYVNFWCEKVKELYPERKLIPFANWRYSDDIVCFDAENLSDEPIVYYVHAFASPGWEDRGYTKSFSEWLKMARIESDQHQRSFN